MSLVYPESSSGLDYGLTEEYIEWLAKLTTLPVIPKGIVRGDDAVRAVNAGARGIMVSNHGGRQLSHEVSTLDALPGVVKAVGKKADVILDGGVRHQSDVLIALALGAKAVTLGRPAMFASRSAAARVSLASSSSSRPASATRRCCAASRRGPTCPADLAVRTGG